VQYCRSPRTEVASLNGTVGRRPQVNLRSRARCLNTIRRGVQPDQLRPGTGALDLRSSPHSPVQRIHLWKELQIVFFSSSSPFPEVREQTVLHLQGAEFVVL